MKEADFLEVYRQTSPLLIRYASRMLRNAAAVEDLVQETYLRALTSDNMPASPTEARAYLFRILSNAITDRWRRERRRESRSHEDVGTVPTRLDSDTDIPRLFAALKLGDRQILWLAHVECYDHSEIGKVLQVSAASVRVLLHRARKRFAELLRAGGYGE